MADIKLESFKAHLQDTIRPNRFWVTVTGTGASNWSESLSYMIKSFVLPARTIGEITLNFMGLQSKLAGDGVFDDVTMTVHVDYAMEVKLFFEQWMESILSIGTEGDNVRLDPQSYKSQIQVDQLGRNGEVIASYMMVGAWPKNMNSIEVSHDSTDTASELNIDFAIEYWYPL